MSFICATCFIVTISTVKAVGGPDVRAGGVNNGGNAACKTLKSSKNSQKPPLDMVLQF